MIVNRGGSLSKEYFLAYLNLVMKSRECSIDEAKDLTFELFFHSNPDQFGRTTYEQFLEAYQKLNNDRTPI